MTILDEIIAHKKKEVAHLKATVPIRKLEESIYFQSPCVSMKTYLKRPHSSGVIAEFKRKSPSKGVINAYADVESTTISYMQAGAAGLSVLTDQNYFGGHNEDLKVARKFNFCPILRKDFIVDAYQIVEAKSIGADVILLIAACLTKSEIIHLTNTANDLGLEVLLELHAKEELDKIGAQHSLIGINNRNLKDFSVNMEHALKMAAQLPADVVKVAESGIKTKQDLLYLRDNGFKGFLMGEAFMKTSNPGKTCQEFIRSVQSCVSKEVSHVD